MAFDEQGQADNYERRIQICERSYNKGKISTRIYFLIQIQDRFCQQIRGYFFFRGNNKVREANSIIFISRYGSWEL